MGRKRKMYEFGCDFWGIARCEDGKLREYNTWYPEKLLNEYNCFAIFTDHIDSLLYMVNYASRHNIEFEVGTIEV